MTSPSLRVGALEIPSCFGKVTLMTIYVEQMIRKERARGLDLVVLCEAALTGYVSPRGDFDLSRFAEPLDGASVAAMCRIARESAVALGFPLIERDGARLFNSYLVADAAGEIVVHYRKRRPWPPERWATPGDRGTPTFALGGVTLTVAVCYDVHTISSMAGDALDASDALLFPSSWVDQGPIDLRSELLPPIARRHSVWIVNPNWGVGAPVWHGSGGSRILSPDGEVAAIAPDDAGLEGLFVTATIPHRPRK